MGANNSTIEIQTRVTADNSQFKHSAVEVESLLKKISTAKAIVKLDLEDNHFIKKYQSVIGEAEKSLRKAFGTKGNGPITYKSSTGRDTKLDTDASLKKALAYASTQSVNTLLTPKEQQAWKDRAAAISHYTETIRAARLATKDYQKLLDSRAIADSRRERLNDTAKHRAEQRITEGREVARMVEEQLRARASGQTYSHGGALLALDPKYGGFKAAAKQDVFNQRLDQNWGAIRETRRLMSLSNGDLQTQIQLERQLNSLYNQRKQIFQSGGYTKSAESFNKQAAAATARKRALEDELKLNREAEKSEDANLKRKSARETKRIAQYEKTRKEMERIDNRDKLFSEGVGNSNPILANMARFYKNQEKEIQSGIKQQQKLERTRFADENVATARQNLQNANTTKDLQRRIEAERELSQALNRRYQYTKNIGDLEASRSHGQEARRLRNEVRLNREAEVQRNRKIAQLEKENALLGRQSGVLGRLKSMLMSYLSLYGIINFGRKIIETTGYFEQQRVALQGITKSAAEANKLLNQIKDFALKSPLQTKDLVNFTKKLAAFSIPTDQLFDTTKKLADLSVGLGIDMDRIVLAYGQVRSAAVLRGQELRQFTEAGIPMVEALRKKLEDLRGTAVSAGEVFEAISKRQISFDIVDSVLTDMTSEGGQFYQMQERINQTLYGQMQKVKDVWTMAFEELGRSSGGFLMKIAKGAQKVAENVRAVFAAISGGVIGKMVGNVANGVMILANNIRIANARGLTLQRVIMSWKAAIAPIITIVSMLAGYVVGLVTQANKLDEKIKEIGTQVAKNTSDAIKGLSTLIGKMSQLARESKTSTKEYDDLMGRLKSNYGDFVSDSIIDSYLKEARTVDQMSKAYENLKFAIEGAILAKNRYIQLDQERDAYADNVLQYIHSMLPGKTGSIVGHHAINEMLYGEHRTGVRNSLTGETLYQKTDKDVAEDYYNLSELGFKKEDFEKSVVQAIASAWSTISRSSDVTTQNFDSQFEEKVISALKLVAGFSELGDDKLSEIAKNATKDIKQQGSWTKLMEKNAEIFNQYENVILRQFENTNPNKDIEGYGKLNKVEAGLQKDKLYIRDLKELIDNVFSKEGIIKNAEGFAELEQLLNTMTADGYSVKAGDAAKVRKSFHELSNNVFGAGASTWKYYMSYTESLFAKYANMLEGRSATVQNRANSMRELYTNENLKHLYNSYVEGIRNDNYEDKRDELVKEYNEAVKRRQSYSGKGDQNAPFIKALDEQIDMMYKLAAPELYDVRHLLKEPGSGNGGFNKWIASIEKYIIEAKALQTKEIEYFGADGAIEEIKKQDTFLSDFYKDGVSPFERIWKELDEAGIEAEGIFSVDELKNAFTPVFKEINGTKFVDFGAMWDQMVDVVEKKYNTTKDEKLKDKLATTIETLVQKGIIIKGVDEVQFAIDAAVRQLSDLATETERMRNTYSKFQQLSANGGYFDALGAFYGGKAENVPDMLGEVQNMFARFLGENVGGYISEAIPDLKLLANGTRANINSLPMIFDLIQQLESLAGVEGLNGEQFKNTKNYFIDALKKLAEEVEKTYKDLQSTRTRNEVTASKFTDAQSVYDQKKALLDREYAGYTVTKIDENGEEVQESHKMDRITYEERMAEAMQEYTKTITEALGGAFNEAVANVTQAFESKTGSSNFGNAMQVLGAMQNGGINGMIGTILGQKVQAGMMSGAEASSMAGGSNGALAIANMIIKLIYDTISGIVDMAKSTIRAMKASNRITISADNGIVNVTSKYSNTKFERTEKTLDAISTFNQHVMDGWNKFMSGDAVGFVTELYSLVPDLIADIKGIQDISIDEEIDKLAESVDNLEQKMSKIDFESNFVSGKEKMVKTSQKVNALLQKSRDLQSEANLEAQKNAGNMDEAKAKMEQAIETQREAYNLMRETMNELLGTADELASKLGDAFVDAFKNGTNSARAWRDSVKEYMGEVLKQMLIFEPLKEQVQKIQEQWFYGFNTYKDENGNIVTAEEQLAASYGLDKDINHDILQQIIQSRISDERLGKQAEKLLDGVYDMATSISDRLSDFQEGLIFYNGDQSQLAGGISGITEDTARTLEGLQNAMLFQMTELNSFFTSKVQVSWFKEQQRLVSSINDAIREMRSGNRPLHVMIDN